MTIIDPHCEHGKRIGDLHNQCHECLDAAYKAAEKEDSSFITILKSVGGVKLCPTCDCRSCWSQEGGLCYAEPVERNKDGRSQKMASARCSKYRSKRSALGAVIPNDKLKILSEEVPCNTCHGTGTVIDLAPLLAKPKELGDVVEELLCKCHIDSDRKFPVMYVNTAMASGYPGLIRVHHYYPMNKSPHYVVGPQRAHSLVYEVARQLCGTAVVALGCRENYKYVGCPEDRANPDAYLLSLPIPSDATVLFVTDKFDEREMREISKLVNDKQKVLPYILCLVGNIEIFTFMQIDKGYNAVCAPGSYLKVIFLHQEKS